MSERKGFGNRFAEAIGVPDDTANPIIDAANSGNLDIPHVLDGHKIELTPAEIQYIRLAARLEQLWSGIVPLKEEE